MTPTRLSLLAIGSTSIIVVGMLLFRASAPGPRLGEPATPVLTTAHYAITSSATPTQTRAVADAAERTYAAYIDLFGDAVSDKTTRTPLQLRLYRDPREFHATSRGPPWAEAYYRARVCHAYYSANEINPLHWMVHESVHQLNEEVAHFKRPPWIDEGLATYFSTSRVHNGKIALGDIDPNTYPLWWLPTLSLSGDLDADVASGKIIPLQALVTSQRANINKNVNLHYIEYWSLTHFLLHAQNGKYADGYRQLVFAGGSIADFTRLVGPVDRIQAQWYAYLQGLIANVDGFGGGDRVIVVDEPDAAMN